MSEKQPFHFRSLLTNESQIEPYYKLLSDWAGILSQTVKCVYETTFDVVMYSAYGDGKMHHTTILMLSRHFCEQLDGISVLTLEGCAEPTKPLLRSAFEASLGVQHILQGDSERRGLAYHVAHVHRKLKMYRKLLPDEQSGKQLRERYKDDPLRCILDQEMPADLPTQIEGLESVLKRPPHADIEIEWQNQRKARKNRDPSWYSLFDGPSTIRGLADNLDKGLWYEFLYSECSDTVHAGCGLNSIAPDPDGPPDAKKIRPLRHPDDLQSFVHLGVRLGLELAGVMLDVYGTEQQKQNAQDQHFLPLLQQCNHLKDGQIINAPW